MSFLDEVLGKVAKEHGIDENKMNEIKEMAGKVDISEIAGKVGISQEAVEKVLSHLKK